MTAPPQAKRTLDLIGKTISGSDLRDSCLSKEQAELEVLGGEVVGELDLSDTEIPQSLVFRKTVFRAHVTITGSRSRSVCLLDCDVLEGFNGNGADITGDLNFSGSRFFGHVMTSASESRSATIWLCEASIGGRFLLTATSISGNEASSVEPEAERQPRAIQGDRLKVRGNLRMTQGFQANGEVRLIGAEINGSLDLSSCSIQSDEQALDLVEAKIGGTIFILPGRSEVRPSFVGQVDLTGSVVEGQILVKAADFSSADQQTSYYRNPQRMGQAFSAGRSRLMGDVDFIEGCRINGRLSFSGAHIAGHCYLNDTDVQCQPDQYAIDCRNLSVESGFEFAGTSGPLRLENSVINGSLHLDDSRISNNHLGRAVQARNVQVQGDVSLISVLFEGITDFKLCRVSGDFRAYGARLDNGDGLVLRLASAVVEGGVFLSNNFVAKGTVRLNRITINGGLSCNNGHFINPGQQAITMFLASIRSGCHLNWTVEGRVEAIGMSTTMLDDDPRNWGDEYDIGGLSYQRLSVDDVDARLAWLSGQDSVDTDGFTRLADHYLQSGHTEASNRVQIERQRAMRRSGRSRFSFAYLWDLFLDFAIGYGYRSNRMALLLLLLIGLTTVALTLPAAEDVMVAVDENNNVYTPNGAREDPGSNGCIGGQVRCFDAPAYAIDTVVPLIDLHQRSTWYPDRASPSGRAYEIGLYFAVILGWMASSTFVFGLTQVFSGKSKS